jgi:CHAT domain-containing protein/Tfp pilus assembly protein PilF
MNRVVRRLGPAAVAAAVLAGTGIGCGAPAAHPAPLTEGAVRDARLAAGESHAYPVALRSGEFLHVVAIQDGADVELDLVSPRGDSLLAVDSPNGPDGPESLAVVAELDGVHRLEVSALAGSGGYRLETRALRSPTADERRLAEALRTYTRAEEERRGLDEPARRRARDGHLRTLELVRGLDAALLEARARHRLGQISSDLGDAAEAVGHFERALTLVRAHGNSWELVPLLNDAGIAYRSRTDLERALACYHEALEVSEQIGLGAGKASALNNLGVLHHSLGELRTALDFYERALAERRRLGKDSREASTLHNLGQIYATLGMLDDSRDFLEQALAVERSRGDRSGEAAALAALGWLLHLEGDAGGALALYDQALALQRETGDRDAVAVSLELRGSALRESGRPREALGEYERALEIFRDLSRPLDEAHALVEMGGVRTAIAEPAEALDDYDRALAIFRRVGVLHGQAAAHLGLAAAERSQGRLTAAREHFEQALDLVESVRGRLQKGALRRSFSATRYDEYGAYVDLLMELDRRQPGQGWAERAFEASERVRGRELVERLDGTAVARSRRASPELLERRAALRRQIQARELQRLGRTGAGDRGHETAELDREVRSLLRQYEELEGEIAGRGPESQPLTLATIQRQLLDGASIVLVYRLAEPRSFLWRVERGVFETWTLPARGEIEPLARQVHELLPKSQAPGLKKQARLAAEALSDLVLGPVAGTLGDRRLVVVSDGALQLVPFAALPVPGDSSPGSEWTPLLSAHEIVHLPSLALLASLRERSASREPAEKQLAVVADPIFERDDPRLDPPAARVAELPVRDRELERSIDDFGVERFERLAHSGAEARAVLSLLPAAARLAAIGPAASRETVLSGELERYRIVHFATHGLLNDRHPALSGLLLSLWRRDGRPRPGMLWAYEIADLELSADLVVLSACRTALGKEVRGEGLLGLSRSFFAAGAARVMVSYWGVDDRATAELMTRFYRLLLVDRLRPAAALRGAQLSMLADPAWRAPYHWAGFALQGDWR